MAVSVKKIEVKGILTKSNLPVADYSVNPYTGCAFACKYCYASFMKRFSNHPEPWGEFLRLEALASDQKPREICREGALLRLGDRSLQSGGGKIPENQGSS